MPWETNYGLYPSFVESYAATYSKGGVPISQPSCVTFDPTIGNSLLTVSSILASDVGVYLVRVTATLTPVPSGTQVSIYFEFNLTILSDCLSTTLTSKTIIAMTNSVSTAAVTQNVSIADSIATSHSIPAHCGARTYNFNPSLSFLTLTGTDTSMTLSLYTTNPTDVSS